MNLQPADSSAHQSYLDFVLPKLRSQPSVSITRMHCLYVKTDGSRCIIGHGLTAAQCEELENHPASIGVDRIAEVLGGSPTLTHFGPIKGHEKMLTVLQTAHDRAAHQHYSAEDFYEKLIHEIENAFGSQIDLTPHYPTSA